jgi:hypothetical protein
VHLLYTDESGASTNANHYVLAGISAFERKPYYLSQELDSIQKEFFPDASEPIEFHASEIRNGNGEPWNSTSREIRMKVMKAVYNVVRANDVTLFAIAMHSASFPGANPVQKTCEELAGHFDAYLANLETTTAFGKQRGLMIFDESKHEKTVQSLLTEYRTTGASFGRIKHLAEVPLFTDSKITRMLQLADFVAYAVFRRYESSDLVFLDQIIHKFHQSNGKLHGLMHLVSPNPECFCSACMSRR